MALELNGISVRYGAVEAVSDVDLAVGDGEVVALLGPSGCGKSTLLRAVAGLEQPSAGVVAWDGVDVAGTPVHRRGFGLVFQDGQLFPHRDVAGNVAFGLRMRREPREVRRARVDELLELVGLGGYQRRKVTELSGGEQQRVALARALAPRPRLLLLDEPLSALDRALRESLAVDLARLLREAGATALVVTHDHDEAFTLADRVAVMRAGRIRQVGPPSLVWRSPVDVEVARFLGCGKVLGAEAARRLLGVPARVGLRATALRVDPDGPLSAEVLERVHRRDHVRLLVRLVGAGSEPGADAAAAAGEAGAEQVGPDQAGADQAGAGVDRSGATGVPGFGGVADEFEAVAPVAAPPAPGDRVRLAVDHDGIAVIG
ncbi:ABC transporter ATP-binding protein [Saccharothrix australiensis]|uniref:ABC-type quaternary amine transporter n=1 Tax=Saccharothrix australiensis TaxID=2072 RepID=A0A495VTQ9_9PSEU|nr:ABC transporter ATP-binding protein [Saccharothrix australiensis]RKT52604.1 thiamine transport system ATP-binding protein [Saccharothrix australiensis]